MLKKSRRYFKGLLEAFWIADIANTSAALAFHTILALIPVLAFIVWYLKELGINRPWRVQVREFILNQFDFGAGEEVLRTIERLSLNVSARNLNYVIFLVLVYTVFNLTKRCGDGLDRVLHSKPTPPGNFTRTVLALYLKRGFAFLTLPLFILASILMTSWLKEDSWLRFLFRHETVGPFLARPIPWLIDVIAIFMLYLFIPKKNIGLKNSFLAALIAGPLFELSKLVMSTYSHNAISVQKIYGALATIPLFFIWIQLSWTIILLGPLLLGLGATRDRRQGEVSKN